MNIGRNIKRIREEHNLTQTELGKIAGVSDKAVSTWENGSAEPRMGAIQKIADHFHIRTIDIIDGSESDLITSDEHSLLDLYRSLNAEGKYELLKQASLLNCSDIYKNERDILSQEA